MNMQERYRQKFNSLDSRVKADNSWERYMKPLDEHLFMRKRYDYSISRLFGNVLDVGSGDGFGAYLMSKNEKIKHITCLEIQDKAINEARRNLNGYKNIKIVKGIGEEIPFKGGFDSVHCGHTLEHAYSDRAVLSEIKRLKPLAIVLSVPLNGGLSLQHVREYSKKEFLFLVEEFFRINEYSVFKRKIQSLVVVAELW